MRITIFLEPALRPDLPFSVGSEHFHRFAEGLGECVGSPVSVVVDQLRNASTDDYILFVPTRDLAESLAECDDEQLENLLARIVLLNVSWQDTLEELELHQLAGAVDSLRMSEWLANPAGSNGFFGRRYLGSAINANCSALPGFRSRHYCLLTSECPVGLTQLLADYLAALEEDQKPLKAVSAVALIP